MANPEQYSRKIAYYIYDDMEPGDRAQFEAELERNVELAEEYRRQLHVVQYLKARTQVSEYFDDPDMEEADRLVEEFYKEKEAAETTIESAPTTSSKDAPATSSRSRSLKYILYPLTAAAAVVGAVLIINTFLPGNVNDRMYRKYYAPMEDASLISRGDGSDFSVDFNRALNQYLDGDYIQSGSEFSTLAVRDPQNAEAVLFRSLSLMGAEDYVESAKLWESFLSRFDTYQPEAKWYLSLCYLKLDQPDKAIPLLAEIASLEGKYGQDSQKLVKRLR